MRARVVFISDELEVAFAALQDGALKNAITRIMKSLALDAFSGAQIQKRLFPKKYVDAYGITTLWKHGLLRGWHLIYTIAGDTEGVTVAILSWMNHKSYEREFKY